MSRQRFIVTGYMARCPIAGVIWQHIHYIVGLQRLGHEVYYIEDSTAHPYHPITYDYVPDWSYTAEIMPKLRGSLASKIGGLSRPVPPMTGRRPA